MKNEYQLRIYLDKETEQALKYMSYKSDKSIAEIVRDALAAYPPLTKAFKESQNISKE